MIIFKEVYLVTMKFSQVPRERANGRYRTITSCQCNINHVHAPARYFDANNSCDAPEDSKKHQEAIEDR